MIRVQVLPLKAGAPEMLFWKGFCTAWDECVELQCSPKDVWVGNTAIRIQQVDRTAVVAFLDGILVGGLLLVEDCDLHVGHCLSVWWQYVLPEYRGRGVSRRLMQQAMQIAREGNFEVLAYTHRLGDWQYKTTYRRTKSVNN